MKHGIPIKEAAIQLGITSVALYTSNKYQPYFIKKKGEKSKFNFDQYKKNELKKELKRIKITFFVEYLKHCKEIDYDEISKKTKIKLNIIKNHTFGYDNALKINKEFDEYIKDFNSFYEW